MAQSDMRKGADTQTLSAENVMDCGNFRHDSLYLIIIYSKKYRLYGNVNFMMKVHP